MGAVGLMSEWTSIPPTEEGFYLLQRKRGENDWTLDPARVVFGGSGAHKHLMYVCGSSFIYPHEPNFVGDWHKIDYPPPPATEGR